jgi:hypothetical protein
LAPPPLIKEAEVTWKEIIQANDQWHFDPAGLKS